MDIDELIERFEIFDDWSDRYRYVIDLGRKLEPLDDVHKTEENRVLGCQSQVWFIVDRADSEQVVFVADSDAIIVKGLIAILLVLYSGKSPDYILATDAKPVFEELGLSGHLSPSRANGFYSMVARIKRLASEHGSAEA
jgi:cysteine desulfuration protein SufE